MTQLMTAAEANRNIYLGKTKQIPRPSAEDARYAGAPETLARHQGEWDRAKAWDDHNAQLHAEHVAKVDADREADVERNRTAARADLEARLRREFLANPAATVADWEVAKAGLIAKALAEAPSAVDVEKARMLASGRYNLI